MWCFPARFIIQWHFFVCVVIRLAATLSSFSRTHTHAHYKCRPLLSTSSRHRRKSQSHEIRRRTPFFKSDNTICPSTHKMRACGGLAKENTNDGTNTSKHALSTTRLFGEGTWFNGWGWAKSPDIGFVVAYNRLHTGASAYMLVLSQSFFRQTAERVILCLRARGKPHSACMLHRQRTCRRRRHASNTLFFFCPFRFETVILLRRTHHPVGSRAVHKNKAPVKMTLFFFFLLHL